MTFSIKEYTSLLSNNVSSTTKTEVAGSSETLRLSYQITTPTPEA